MLNTSRYVEPTQHEVYSFEFQKIIILACSEVETAFKLLCTIINHDNQFKCDIGEYKRIILEKYPKIVQAEVDIPRAHITIRPFEKWDSIKLFWWNAYQNIKHNRGNSFEQATYLNAVNALGALYILVFYLAQIEEYSFSDNAAKYLDSDYSHQTFTVCPTKTLPDFKS